MKKELKLKTLKDFKPKYNDAPYYIAQLELIGKLKAEAVKWIDNQRTKHMNANDFILVFFNLTEEDLK